MTKVRLTDEQRAAYHRHAQKCVDTNMSATKYAKENRLNGSTLYYYVHQIRSKSKNGPMKVNMRRPMNSGFIPVHTGEQRTYEVQVGKAIVRVPVAELKNFLSEMNND